MTKQRHPINSLANAVRLAARRYNRAPGNTFEDVLDQQREFMEAVEAAGQKFLSDTQHWDEDAA